jgi:micrococcal nuclease
VAQSMGGWTLSDNASHVYTFAQFTLHPGASVTVHTGSGTDSAADLFWGRGCVQGSYFGCVWNDGGDKATLKDGNGNTISTYEY